ncbi:MULTISPECIES: hypothetical protein [Chitinophagaceae]
MYFNTGFRDYLLGMTKEGLMQLNRKEAGRFMGFGAFFMNLGVANGVGMMLIVLLLKNSDYFKLNKGIVVQLILSFILIAVLGNFQARTTLICALISILFFILSTLKLNVNLLKRGFLRVLGMLLIAVVLMIGIATLFPDFVAEQSGTLDYGFELINSAQAGKGLHTTSSNILSDMLQIWPATPKTWWIGDGYYLNPLTGGFYMYTDVGYARLIFYFGIVGMIVFYVYELILVYLSFYKSTRLWKAFLFYFIIMVLVVNLKSFTEYAHYMAIFFMINQLDDYHGAISIQQQHSGYMHHNRLNYIE